MLVFSDLVQCPSLGSVEILHDRLIAVDDKGFITCIVPSDSDEAVDLSKQFGSSEEVITVPKGSFIAPTFCDIHLHAPQYMYQGTGLDLPLMQWLDEYAFKAEQSLDADIDLASKVYKRLTERLIENGTGAVLLFGTIKEETNLVLAELMQEAGIRAFVGKLSMDKSTRPTYSEASTKDSLASLNSFVEAFERKFAHLPTRERLVEPVVTPRFVPMCSDELLSGLGAFAKERGLRIQSHLAEAHDQVEWVKKERGLDDMDVFERSELLTSQTVQAHCTFLPRSSLDFLATKGVSVAHCPLSNCYFSSEPFKLREALDAGVKVGLGTDIAGGYSSDIMNAMRHAVCVSRIREGARTNDLISRGDGMKGGTDLRINWKEALYLATRGGARALGLECGKLVVGAPFDAQQIRLVDSERWSGVGPLDFFDQGARELDEDMVEKWWCVGDSRNRVRVWVQGRILSGMLNRR